MIEVYKKVGLSSVMLSEPFTKRRQKGPWKGIFSIHFSFFHSIESFMEIDAKWPILVVLNSLKSHYIWSQSSKYVKKKIFFYCHISSLFIYLFLSCQRKGINHFLLLLLLYYDKKRNISINLVRTFLMSACCRPWNTIKLNLVRFCFCLRDTNGPFVAFSQQFVLVREVEAVWKWILQKVYQRIILVYFVFEGLNLVSEVILKLAKFLINLC